MQKQAKILLDKFKYLKRHKEEIIKLIQSLTIENIYNPISYIANVNELLAKVLKIIILLNFIVYFRLLKN